MASGDEVISARARTRRRVHALAAELRAKGWQLNTGVMHLLRDALADVYQLGWEEALERPTVPAPPPPDKEDL